MIVIYGGGGHGKMVIDLLRARGAYQVVGIIDDGLNSGSMIMGVPVLGGANVLARAALQGSTPGSQCHRRDWGYKGQDKNFRKAGWSRFCLPGNHAYIGLCRLKCKPGGRRPGFGAGLCGKRGQTRLRKYRQHRGHRLS
jgi:hypothetical protein